MRHNKFYAASGVKFEATPSEADIKVTRDLIRAGQLLKIEVLDHVVLGNPNHSSLRELGFFA
jgi:DNA repair protein RadC